MPVRIQGKLHGLEQLVEDALDGPPRSGLGAYVLHGAASQSVAVARVRGAGVVFRLDDSSGEPG